MRLLRLTPGPTLDRGTYFAVVLDGEVLAMFQQSDSAARWKEGNYRDRVDVAIVEVAIRQ